MHLSKLTSAFRGAPGPDKAPARATAAASEHRHIAHAASSLFAVAAVVLVIAILVVDTVTALEIAVAVFYVAVVLMSVSFCQKRGVLLVSAGCMILTVVSYFLTEHGALRAGLINCLISLSAIGITTYLALQIGSAQAAVHEARAQLAHIARVTTLGELTVSIAHEVNQPLTGAVTSGNACLRWLAADPPNVERARQAVERIIKDANRASEVIKRVRGLAKREPPQKEWLNINDTILEIVALTHSEVRRNAISLRTQLSDALPPILGDRIQLQQVILNLILNAIEAIGATRDGPRELTVSSGRDDTNGVLVAIQDSGTGLDPGKLDLPFDAFYTTKPEGVGMGLTISRSIIEAHGGRVWAEPNAPRGAVLQFTLPTSGAE